MSTAVEENLARIRGTLPSRVRLIAVTKGVQLGAVRHAYDAGQRDFGESRLQEALPKIEALPKDITWHFIGKLQSNKARAVAKHFHVIHTLENGRQLAELSKIERPIDALIEVNIGEEPQKSGILPEVLDSFIESVLECNQVRLKGLMTIGPAHPNAESMRPYFHRLREMSEKLGDGAWLSMGMSQDFEVAIQEGSTHIRVGSLIFGART